MHHRAICHRLLLVLTLVTALAGSALAQEAAPSGQTQDEIRQVIESQLQAFQRDDAAGAFAFASPKIRALFGNPDSFLEMVKKGYQPVYRPRRVAFRTLRLLGNTLIQEVFFVGPDGGEALALYIMARQPDGTWRIDGVQLVDPGDQAA